MLNQTPEKQIHYVRWLMSMLRKQLLNFSMLR